jgi:hypothetical protein
MSARALALTTLLAASAILGACSSDNTLGLAVAGSGTSGDTLNNAHVRFVNATETSLDVATAGVVGAGNGGIGYGSSSSCISTNPTTANLSVRLAGTSTVVPGFATVYQSGVNYTVIAYAGTGGATQFATITDTFTPIAGQSGLRVFNAGAPGTSYDVYVTAPGASLTTETPTFSAVLAGTNSSFINVSTSTAQQVRITAAGTKTVLLDVGNVALVVGQSVTMVIAPPVSGSSAPRSFLVAICG